MRLMICQESEKEDMVQATCGHSGLAWDDQGRCHHCVNIHQKRYEATGPLKSLEDKTLVKETRWSKWSGKGRNRVRRKVGSTWVWTEEAS